MSVELVPFSFQQYTALKKNNFDVRGILYIFEDFTLLLTSKEFFRNQEKNSIHKSI